MNNRLLFYLITLAAIVLLVYALFFKPTTPLRHLPHYGEHHIDSLTKDTAYHTIADFEFYDQTGKKITQQDFKDKIYVADYFFTTCQSICPIMSGQMERVYTTFKNNPHIKFISHTVDPETDSISVLADYAHKHNADPHQWHFVTGDKKQLYELARKSYYFDAQEGDGGPDDFIHTPNFALIDKEKRIRGYYNGTDSTAVNQLIMDITILLEEYHH